MPSAARPLVLVAALAVLPRLTSAQAAAATSTAPAASVAATAPLAWLAGCWEQRTPRRIVQEQWLAPAGGMLQGMGRTLRRTAAGDSVAEFEFLRIVSREGGTLAYLAQPGGQPPTEFTSHAAHSASDTSVTFTNLAHDFPQRITYARRGADSLLARVEGTVNGATRAIEFPYARAVCR